MVKKVLTMPKQEQLFNNNFSTLSILLCQFLVTILGNSVKDKIAQKNPKPANKRKNNCNSVIYLSLVEL